MKKNLLFLALFFFAISAFSQEYIFKFKVNSPKEFIKMNRLVSIDHGYGVGDVVAYANVKQFEYFKTLGYEYEMMPHPFEGKTLTMATTVAQMSNWDRYPTFEVLNQMIDQFAVDYPNICRVETIGTSEDGRAVKVVKLTDNPDIDEKEPEFFYTGQMHGDEIVDYVLFLRLIDYMLSNYGTDSRVTNLINNVEIWINPLSNPDGTYAGGNSTVGSATRSNSNNIDLNRSFPTPNLPTPSGVNEEEVQMMMNFADNHNFVMSANSHSGIELINYPWDTWYSSDNKHADHNWFGHISYNYADTVHDNSSSYFFGEGDGVTHGADWYPVDGSRQDYMTYYQNCREVTLELSNAKALDANLLPAHWDYNRSAFLGYIEECLYGFNGTVKNTNGDPLDAKIEIALYDKDNSEVYTDLAKGNYYRPIEPGTYDVTYSSYGYIPQTHSVIITAYETSVTKNVVLTQATTVTVTGTVIEAETSNALDGVTIEFLESPVNTITSANGTYSVDVMENTYQIKASKIGYTAVTKTIDISTSNTVVDFTLAISNAISFETEVPSIFTFSGNTDWTRVTPEAYDGIYSMKSGNISDSESSIMEIEINVTSAGDISFYKKVSSEGGWDFLKFYIDGTEKGSWSGTVDWSQESFAVSTGIHAFKWEYIKDTSQNNGEDCVWVDYIELPHYEESASYTISGIVTDIDGGTPINGATVSINGTSFTTVTIADGTYLIANVIVGVYEIKASASGYSQSVQNITISETNFENIDFELNISNAESFEGGIPENYSFSGNLEWTRENDKAYDGTWSMKSGSIGDSENSIMEVSKTTDAGTVSFRKFVSSESGYDFLKFYIDGTEKGSWSGTEQTEWTVSSYSVTEGTHIFKWEYIKDISTDGGNDCAWVDYVELPATAVSIANNLFNNTHIKISPNPFNQNTSFEFSINKKSDVYIGIYSYNGSLVKTLVKQELDSGNHRVIWNGTNNNNQRLSNGVYFCKISNEGQTKTEKIILLK